MTKKEQEKSKDYNCDVKSVNNDRIGHSGDAVYFFGLIGAAVYFVSIASGFWEIILALLKAIAWPAFVVYELLKFLM